MYGKPTRIKSNCEDKKNKRLWFMKCLNKTIHAYLETNYNTKQFEAIVNASYPYVCQRHMMNSVRGKEIPNSSSTMHSIFLLQGPPGTGKTHTVCGILNLWHMLQYQRYYRSLENFFMHPLVADFFLHNLSIIEREKIKQTESKFFSNHIRFAKLIYDLIENRSDSKTKKSSIATNLYKFHEISNAKLPILLHKPKILICTPSNASIDELLGRVLIKGFIDLEACTYFPTCIRIGCTGAIIDTKAREILIETQIYNWMTMSDETINERLLHAKAKLESVSSSMLQYLILVSSGTAMCSVGREIVHCFGELEKYLIEIERLGIIKDKYADYFLIGEPRTRIHSSSHRFSHSQNVYENLESSLIDQSQLIFSTISSCGGNRMKQMIINRSFRIHSVLIDEACQAYEVSTLQSLIYDSNHIGLVGDPKQLPATTLSESIKINRLDRSLFERYTQAGCNFHMLALQYRMHPFIRQFPSRQFYSNHLFDSHLVSTPSPVKFNLHRFLKPYVIFDVDTGKEIRHESSSYLNSEEALLTLSIYFELKDYNFEHENHQIGDKLDFGIITPYRQQRNFLT
jgi:senataxin